MKRNWKFYLGIGLLSYSCIPWLLLMVLPFLGFSLGEFASLLTGLLVSAEVAFLLSIVLLGKPFVDGLTARFKRLFSRSNK